MKTNPSIAAPRPSLQTKIRSETLPRLLMFLIALFFAALFTAWLVLQQTSHNAHQKSLNAFESNIEQQLKYFEAEIENLSNNHFIVNALIDYQVRNEYLPVFFRSLKLAQSEQAAILMTDFAGEVIASNQERLFDDANIGDSWKEDVLLDGRSYLSLRTNGIVVAAPIFYADLPEGALVIYLPDVQSAFAQTILGLDPNIRFSVQNKAGSILFQSDTEIDANSFLSFLNIRTVRNINQLTLTSEQHFISAYGQIFMLISIGLTGLVIVYIASIFTIRMATSSASKVLRNLEKSLDQVRKGDTELEIEDADVSEVEALKHSYNRLISELRMTSQSLKTFEGIINSLGEHLLVLGHNGEVLLNNQALVDFANGQDVKQDYASLLPKALIEGNHEHPYVESTYISSESEALTMLWTRSDYINEAGHFLGVIYVGADVSEQRALQTDLEIKQAAIDEAHTPIIISAYEPGTPIIYANTAFTEFTGYETHEIMGRNCSFMQGENTDAAIVDKIREALSKAEPLTTTLINYKKDGSEFFNELTLSPIKNSAGNVTHVLGLLTDVTKEENLKNYLSDAKRKAEESAKLKSQFLASMSHEIRTPMNGVLGMIQLLENSELSSEQKHHAHLAKSSANALLAVINDILDFSKIEAGKLELECLEFDLVNMLSDLTESLSQSAIESGNELLLDLGALHFRQFKSDPNRIRQVLFNLLSNAIKFTHDGEITISASDSQDGKRLSFSIRDTGIGIETSRLEHIFSAFTQADSSTTRQYGGTGLGLSICNELVHHMGGEIQVESEAGKGSCFSFSIQLDAQASETKHRLRAPTALTTVAVLDSQTANHKIIADHYQAYQIVTQAITDSTEIDQLSSAEQPTALFVRGRDYDKTLDSQLKQIHDRGVMIVFMTEIDAQLPDSLDDNVAQLIHWQFPCPVTPNDLDQCLERLAESASAKSKIEHSAFTDDHKANTEVFRALLVEDNPVNQLVAKTLLENNGLDVVIAEDGLKALEELREDKHFDIIFMDCQMPRMDGYEASREIRAGKAGANYVATPIIAMTANAVKGDREKCLQAGMSDYVSKPVNAETLAATTMRWLQNKEAHPE